MRPSALGETHYNQDCVAREVAHAFPKVQVAKFPTDSPGKGSTDCVDCPRAEWEAGALTATGTPTPAAIYLAR
jgi:hypothetical protein